MGTASGVTPSLVDVGFDHGRQDCEHLAHGLQHRGVRSLVRHVFMAETGTSTVSLLDAKTGGVLRVIPVGKGDIDVGRG
jgi:hypothetical protein